MLGSSARPRSGALFILAEIDGCFDFSSLGFEKKVAELAESIKQIRSSVQHFQGEGRRQNAKGNFQSLQFAKELQEFDGIGFVNRDGKAVEHVGSDVGLPRTSHHYIM